MQTAEKFSDLIEPKIQNDVRIIEHVWITMSDGVRLSAKLWLPVDAVEQPVPAILEIIPYRKRDATAQRDHSNHAWLSARGYACIRPGHAWAWRFRGHHVGRIFPARAARYG